MQETGPYKNLSDAEKQEVVAHFAFSMMVGNIDVVQLRKANERIYQIDFADTFNTSSMMLSMAYGMNQTALVKKFLTGFRNSFADDVAMLHFDLDYLARNLDMDVS